jgi:hypothetical protein
VADDEEIAFAGLGLTADEGPQALRAMTNRYSLPMTTRSRLTANHSGTLSAAKTPTERQGAMVPAVPPIPAESRRRWWLFLAPAPRDHGRRPRQCS